MNYIKKEGDTITCTHPLVEKIWQVGYDARKHEDDEPVFKTKTLMVMKDGERKDFIDNKKDFDNAEKYLQTLK